jgi:hypothetical protein
MCWGSDDLDTLLTNVCRTAMNTRKWQGKRPYKKRARTRTVSTEDATSCGHACLPGFLGLHVFQLRMAATFCNMKLTMRKRLPYFACGLHWLRDIIHTSLIPSSHTHRDDSLVWLVTVDCDEQAQVRPSLVMPTRHVADTSAVRHTSCVVIS